jgi:hypothetical protein
MPFDKNKAAQYIRANALPPFGNGHCAPYVRKSLEAGGLNTAGHPVPAKDWGPTLTHIGFRTVPDASYYHPQTGDVIVFQSVKGHPYGHIELYDGQNWVSDFIQQDMWPARAYQAEKAKYQVYRYGS